MSATYDAFRDLAPFYDRIMDHVNYDRWYVVAQALSRLLPAGFVHLDAACGTGRLLKRLRLDGWNSIGADLSFAMVHAGKKEGGECPAVAADLRALPLCDSVDYVTCLFDSINFLIEFRDLAQAFRSVGDALRDGGLFYFDVVTERMVTEHFEGQQWTEDNGRFSTTWRSQYDRHTAIADTHVRVNTGPSGTVRERIYLHEDIERALDFAGLSLLGAFDAHSWKAPGKRTVRIDYIAAKGDARVYAKRFKSIYNSVRGELM